MVPVKNLSKINFSIPNTGEFAALASPVGGAAGVLYARRSADGIFTGGRTESGLAHVANLICGQVLRNDGSSAGLFDN